MANAMAVTQDVRSTDFISLVEQRVVDIECKPLAAHEELNTTLITIFEELRERPHRSQESFETLLKVALVRAADAGVHSVTEQIAAVL